MTRRSRAHRSSISPSPWRCSRTPSGSRPAASGASAGPTTSWSASTPSSSTHGYGGHIVDVDGNEYIDMLCAYGPIILGYVEPEINDAAKAQMDKGFCFSLVQPLQNELEQRLTDIMPCGEQTILVKTGSDATNAAVRAARAYTGRDKIARCGYHGWDDWCVEHPRRRARRPSPSSPWSSSTATSPTSSASSPRTRARSPASSSPRSATRMAKPSSRRRDGLPARRSWTWPTSNGAVLIFDEIRTGFRVAMGGASERYGVTPDLTTVGKAMANGYAIAALVGKREVMAVYEKNAFISSTYFPNSLEMAASMKCLEILEREKVQDAIWERGTRFLERLGEIVDAVRRAGDQVAASRRCRSSPSTRPTSTTRSGARSSTRSASAAASSCSRTTTGTSATATPSRPGPGARGGRGVPGRSWRRAVSRAQAESAEPAAGRPQRGSWMDKLIITVAGVGAETTKEAQPALPVTAAEIGADAARCREAGASMYHLHVRDADGNPTQAREVFAAAIAEIRERTDIIIQTSTGGAMGMTADERLQPLELGPGDGLAHDRHGQLRRRRVLQRHGADDASSTSACRRRACGRSSRSSRPGRSTTRSSWSRSSARPARCCTGTSCSACRAA